MFFKINIAHASGMHMQSIMWCWSARLLGS